MYNPQGSQDGLFGQAQEGVSAEYDLTNLMGFPSEFNQFGQPIRQNDVDFNDLHNDFAYTNQQNPDVSVPSGAQIAQRSRHNQQTGLDRQVDPRSNAGQINSISPLNQPSQTTSMNHVNQINQIDPTNSMNQVNQMNQMNQINQMNPISQMSQMNQMSQMSQVNQLNGGVQTNRSSQEYMDTTVYNSQRYQRPQGSQIPQSVQGVRGSQGVQGFQGVQGVQGVQRAQGNQGVRGVQGVQGVQRVQSVQGVQGQSGPSGHGITLPANQRLRETSQDASNNKVADDYLLSELYSQPAIWDIYDENMGNRPPKLTSDRLSNFEWRLEHSKTVLEYHQRNESQTGEPFINTVLGLTDTSRLQQQSHNPHNTSSESTQPTVIGSGNGLPLQDPHALVDSSTQYPDQHPQKSYLDSMLSGFGIDEQAFQIDDIPLAFNGLDDPIIDSPAASVISNDSVLDLNLNTIDNSAFEPLQMYNFFDDSDFLLPSAPSETDSPRSMRSPPSVPSHSNLNSTTNSTVNSKANSPMMKSRSQVQLNKDSYISKSNIPRRKRPTVPTQQVPKIPKQTKVKSEGLYCSNCNTTTTPLWRRDDEGNALCNACGLFHKLHGMKRPLKLKTDVIKRRNRQNTEEYTPQPARRRSQRRLERLEKHRLTPLAPYNPPE